MGRPLDHLPEIGERIEVLGSLDEWKPATIISMSECRKINPALWSDAFGKIWPEEDKPYTDQDTIRAFKFDDGTAAFCIMRFSHPAHGFTYNLGIRLLTATSESLGSHP
jgi:hypothetical protein